MGSATLRTCHGTDLRIDQVADPGHGLQVQRRRCFPAAAGLGTSAAGPAASEVARASAGSGFGAAETAFGSPSNSGPTAAARQADAASRGRRNVDGPGAHRSDGGVRSGPDRSSDSSQAIRADGNSSSAALDAAASILSQLARVRVRSALPAIKPVGMWHNDWVPTEGDVRDRKAIIADGDQPFGPKPMLAALLLLADAEDTSWTKVIPFVIILVIWGVGAVAKLARKAASNAPSPARPSPSLNAPFASSSPPSMPPLPRIKRSRVIPVVPPPPPAPASAAREPTAVAPPMSRTTSDEPSGVSRADVLSQMTPQGLRSALVLTELLDPPTVLRQSSTGPW